VTSAALLEAVHLEHRYGAVRALDDVSLAIAPGETFGLVGESGCGKSTLARALLGLLEPTAGTVRFDGRDIAGLGRRARRALCGELQIVFQDHSGSLNPRRRVDRIVRDPMRRHDPNGSEGLEARVAALLEQVGLSAEQGARFPHELSAGQRQRVGIARALAPAPRLVIADEPVSALDVSVQAQILNLLCDLRDELGVTWLLIAHDLGVVRQVSDRIGVMYLGKLVEVAPTPALFARPVHPYTGALLDAGPVPDPRASRRARIVLSGDPGDAADPPPGCRFHPRCPRASALCAESEPPLVSYGAGRLAACHHPAGVTPEELAGARVAPASPRSAGDALPRAPYSSADSGASSSPSSS